jgi:RNA polymerase sigma factor for flagellar operon FliA
LIDETGHIPTPEEIAEEAGITVKALDDLFLSARTVSMLSLNNGREKTGEAGNLLDALADTDCLNPAELAEKAETKELLMKAMIKLPEAERQVVFLYYNQNLLLKEIGAVLKVSESRICQILGRAHYLLSKEIKNMGG